ncbi:SMP-30/gluconolactonase/LRE family protein [Flammeovirga sp. MY04]|uniref:SMP-30/gluconolactonase/LRE family protein n=1 Tax=Flammeovirga sp. MY04 TaxID=1191459 RepID=UPI0008062E61|nr:SMP-30/gluconolactonase/LRE family protein [Flammeovirga sp. MY04]ANQ51661.1 SMP-30/gluconolactonase/LRE family protein [Flammeovirga sp. MY04]
MEKAKLIYNGKATLGEGPIWLEDSNELMWVDIEKTTLNFLDLQTYMNQEFLIGQRVGFAAVKDTSTFYLGTQEGIFEFDRNTSSKKFLHQPPTKFDENIRFNDGKIGPDGALYAGTMHLSVVEGAGTFYKIETNGEYIPLIQNTTIANGLGWSPDKKITYFIDTPNFEVMALELSEDNLIMNKRIVISIPQDYGAPDGMTVDKDGNVWIAHWGGAKVSQWNPDKNECLKIIEVGVPNVTSCTFIDHDCKKLAITTANFGMSDKELNEYPLSGGIFLYELK